MWVLRSPPIFKSLVRRSLGLCFPSKYLQTLFTLSNTARGLLGPQHKGPVVLTPWEHSWRWGRAAGQHSSPSSWSPGRSVHTHLASTCKEKLAAKTCLLRAYSVQPGSLSGRLFLFVNMKSFGKPAHNMLLSFTVFFFFFNKEVFLQLWFSLLSCTFKPCGDVTKLPTSKLCPQSFRWKCCGLRKQHWRQEWQTSRH